MTVSEETLASKLVTKKRLLTNIGINYITRILPVLVGFFTIPMLMHGLGIERFGILTLIWAVIGYSSIFDLGLGRAQTQLIAKRIGENDLSDLPETIWTTLLLITILATLVGLAIFFLAPWLVTFMKVSAPYREETIESFRWLSLSLPSLIWVISTTGIFEAFQRFLLINVLRIPILFCNFVLPVILLHYYHSLAPIVCALALGRIIVSIVMVACIGIAVPRFYQQIAIQFKNIPDLFRFGFWITVSNLISPFMTTMDRFILSNLTTTAVIAYYTTPYDMVGRIKEILSSTMNVMFPAFGIHFFSDRQRGYALYHRCLLYMGLICTLVSVLAIVLAKPALAIWLGADFAQKSYWIACMSTIAVMLNVMNWVPLSVVQAAGRSDLAAKLTMIEFPFYIVLFFGLVWQWGVIGAPIAMAIRFLVDTVILHIFVERMCDTPMVMVAEGV